MKCLSHVELAVKEQGEFNLPAESTDIGLREY
jgi:hypothetical protein